MCKLYKMYLRDGRGNCWSDGRYIDSCHRVKPGDLCGHYTEETMTRIIDTISNACKQVAVQEARSRHSLKSRSRESIHAPSRKRSRSHARSRSRGDNKKRCQATITFTEKRSLLSSLFPCRLRTVYKGEVDILLPKCRRSRSESRCRSSIESVSSGDASCGRPGSANGHSHNVRYSFPAAAGNGHHYAPGATRIDIRQTSGTGDTYLPPLRKSQEHTGYNATPPYEGRGRSHGYRAVGSTLPIPPVAPTPHTASSPSRRWESPSAATVRLTERTPPRIRWDDVSSTGRGTSSGPGSSRSSVLPRYETLHEVPTGLRGAPSTPRPSALNETFRFPVQSGTPLSATPGLTDSHSTPSSQVPTPSTIRQHLSVPPITPSTGKSAPTSVGRKAFCESVADEQENFNPHPRLPDDCMHPFMSPVKERPSAPLSPVREMPAPPTLRPAQQAQPVTERHTLRQTNPSSTNARSSARTQPEVPRPHIPNTTTSRSRAREESPQSTVAEVGRRHGRNDTTSARREGRERRRDQPTPRPTSYRPATYYDVTDEVREQRHRSSPVPSAAPPARTSSERRRHVRFSSEIDRNEERRERSRRESYHPQQPEAYRRHHRAEPTSAGLGWLAHVNHWLEEIRRSY